MTTPAQIRSASTAIVLYSVLLLVVLAACSLARYYSRQTDYSQPELAGEHSVLVQVEP